MKLLLSLFLFLVLANISMGKRDANQKLKACCARQKNADKDCKRKFCDFNILTKDNVMTFLNTCNPKGSTVQDMWDCASSRVDHTECCRQNNVVEECLPYCKSGKSTPTEYFKHLFCMQAFNGIKNCFRSYLDNHPNIFGDK
uniref:DB domain-containing protein n=1 Tax=Strongyloides papillosus TaxID=174720 RepID=A0A0N5C3D0_STREA